MMSVMRFTRALAQNHFSEAIMWVLHRVVQTHVAPPASWLGGILHSATADRLTKLPA